MKQPRRLKQHELDQLSAEVCNGIVPHYAAVFRAFCNEPEVSREEAMRLTIAMMHMPSRPDDEGAE